MTKGLKL